MNMAVKVKHNYKLVSSFRFGSWIYVNPNCYLLFLVLKHTPEKFHQKYLIQ